MPRCSCPRRYGGCASTFDGDRDSASTTCGGPTSNATASGTSEATTTWSTSASSPPCRCGTAGRSSWCKRAHVALIAHPADQARAQALLGLAEEAFTTLAQRWNRPWAGSPRRVRAQVARRTDRDLIQATVDVTKFVAFVSYSTRHPRTTRSTAPRLLRAGPRTCRAIPRPHRSKRWCTSSCTPPGRTTPARSRRPGCTKAWPTGSPAARPGAFVAGAEPATSRPA